MGRWQGSVPVLLVPGVPISSILVARVPALAVRGGGSEESGSQVRSGVEENHTSSVSSPTSPACWKLEI